MSLVMKTVTFFFVAIVSCLFPAVGQTEEPKENCLHAEGKTKSGKPVSADICMMSVESLFFHQGWIWGHGVFTPPYKMVSHVDVVVDGKHQYIPPSAYIDIASVKEIRLVAFNDNSVGLFFDGGDAGTSFLGYIELKNGYTTKRDIANGINPNDAWEETEYHYHQVSGKKTSKKDGSPPPPNPIKKKECLHDAVQGNNGEKTTAEVCMVTIDKPYFKVEKLWGHASDTSPFRMISDIEVIRGGKKQEMSVSAMIDLTDVRSIKLLPQSDGTTNLLLKGGEGDESYSALLSYKYWYVVKRHVARTLYPEEEWEETKYHYNMMSEAISYEEGNIIGESRSDGTVIMYDKPRRRGE